MQIGNVKLKNKIICAPLAGYTNLSYREILSSMGAGLVYTEMVSAKGLIYENDKTYQYIATSNIERPVAVQLFGGEINDLVKATKIVCDSGFADIIDINMGCPVRKVLKQGAGSYLLQDPQKVYEMVNAVVEVSNVPVTVKIRAGWDHNSVNCIEIAKNIERAKASAITIHGRTKSDLYSGKVNLDFIKLVKESVDIPVIGNGDIKTIDDAKKMFEYTNCDAIMVGRASLGNPWFINDLVRYFSGESLLEPPSAKEKIEMIKHHYFQLKKLKCEKIALLEMRTMALYYLKSLPNTKKIKLEIVKCETEKQFLDLLDKINGE